MAVGNLDAAQPDFGRYDAGYGLVLMGDGKQNFTPLDAQQSGFVVRGQGRDIKSLMLSGKARIFLVSRNNDSIKLFTKVK